MLSSQTYPTLTIPQGQAESVFAASSIGEWTWKRILGLFLPVGFEGTSITFKASFDGTNWFDLYNLEGAVYTISAVAGGRYYPLDPLVVAGIVALKVVASQNQTAARNIVASVRPVS